MNIFYLDSDPKLCAQYHGDKHVVKMVLETAQLLSTAIRINTIDVIPPTVLYAPTHVHHPCTQWAAASSRNFLWLQQLGIHLAAEYTYRYGRKHASESTIRYVLNFANQCNWASNAALDRPQCMPEIYRQMDAQDAYRNYYLGEKTHLLSYTRRHVPEWVAALGLGEHK